MEHRSSYIILLVAMAVCFVAVTVWRGWYDRRRLRKRISELESEISDNGNNYLDIDSGSSAIKPYCMDDAADDAAMVAGETDMAYGIGNTVVPVSYDCPARTMTLIVDTETTGLPLNGDVPCTVCPENWPRMVRISWLVVDDSGAVVSDNDMIVRPSGFVIPPEVVEIHGITTEMATAEGVDLRYALSCFAKDACRCGTLVGHNIFFDRNVIGAECIRMGVRDMLTDMRTLCTMKLSTLYCAIPHPKYVYKWPRLGELYYILFGHDLENAHNGAADARAVFDSFVQLKKLGVINV